MKNLKKFLAVLVVIAVMATMMLPAFAEDAISADAQICKDLGILKGSAGVDAAYLAKTTQRLQAAILTLRLLGKESYALEFDSDENFEDADTVSWEAGRNVMAYLKERPDLGWTGGTDGTFAPYGIATPAHIYKVILELLGYRQGVDFAWSGVMVFAELKGLAKLKDVKELTNDWMATALVEGLKTKTAAGNETLIEKLVRTGIIKEADAIKVGLLAMKVVSAAADSAVQITVKFNKPAFKDTATAVAASSLGANNVANYGVDGVAPTSAELAADGLSVKLMFAATIAGTNKTLTVKPIASAANAADKSALFTSTYTFADSVAPKYASVAYPSFGTAEVTFSEPMSTLGTVTLAGTLIAPAVKANTNDMTYTVDISGSPVDTDLALVFVGAKDKAGNFIAPNPTTVTLKKVKTDTTAPAVASATANSDRYISVVFTEKLSAAPTVTISDATTSVAVTLTTTDSITYTGALSPYYTGVGKINVAAGYTDMSGNAGAVYKSGFLQFTADSTKPALVSAAVEVISNVPYLVFKYSENVTTNAALTISGTKVAGSVTYALGSTTLTAPTVPYVNGTTVDPKAVMVNITELPEATYSVTAAAGLVKDISDNQSEAAAISFTRGAISTVADTTAPTISSITVAPDNSFWTVVFSENLDPATALAVANYKVNGAAIFSAAILNGNAATVKLTVIPGSITFTGVYPIAISGVKDVAGNVMAAYSNTTTSINENVIPTIASAALTTLSTVTVTFSENITVAAGSVAFTYCDGTNTTYTAVANAASSGKTVVVTIPTVSDITKTLSIKLVGTATDASGNVAATGVVVNIAK